METEKHGLIETAWNQTLSSGTDIFISFIKHDDVIIRASTFYFSAVRKLTPTNSFILPLHTSIDASVPNVTVNIIYSLGIYVWHGCKTMNPLEAELSLDTDTDKT